MRAWWVVAAVAACNFNQVNPPIDPVEPDITRPNVFNGEAISADVAPLPISGGTLLVAPNGHIFASNPDHDEVVEVDSSTRQIVWHAPVPAGSDPGRLVQDSSNKVHVLLRRGGSIATIDPVEQKVTERKVCPAPRGLALNGDALIVACNGGELVTVPLDGSAATTKSFGRDLRDVVIKDKNIYVSRFRAAGLINRSQSFNRWSRPTISSTRKASSPARSDSNRRSHGDRSQRPKGFSFSINTQPRARLEFRFRRSNRKPRRTAVVVVAARAAAAS
jgi:hypothetical protein